MKNTNLIAFSGGSYGTYLEWALTTLCGIEPISDPGGKEGNSHMFKGYHLRNMQQWNAYYRSSDEYKFARIHPKTMIDHSLIKNLDQLSRESVRVINLYPDNNTYLLVIHNYLLKIWDDLWNGSLKYVKKEDIYDNWDVDRSLSLDQLPRWIQREYFSYNLFSSWEAQVEWDLAKVLPEKTNCRYFFVHDLLFDFETTMIKLQTYLNIEYVRPVRDIVPYHQQNIARQRFINQQALSESIIDAACYQKNIEWNRDDLTLFSEAWVQKQLRDKGFNLRCHGLDAFPNNSVQLTKLLY